MKAFLTLGALATSAVAQTAQFTNTSFTGPFNVGETVPLMWTTGNGLPITLSISNSTWSYQIFDGHAVLPTTYQWTISAPPGFVSGDYQLALSQIGSSQSNSSVFSVQFPDASASSSVTTAVPESTVTMTYVYWDHQCGCTKTASTFNTGAPVTTSHWWDESCGCHTSAMVPVTTLSAANNYTAPTLTTPMPSSTAMPPTTTQSPPSATFTGEAVRLGSSVLGVLALIMAAVVA